MNKLEMIFTSESIHKEKRINSEFYSRVYEFLRINPDLRMIPYLSKELGDYRLNYRFESESKRNLLEVQSLYVLYQPVVLEVRQNLNKTDDEIYHFLAKEIEIV
ncbi:MAG: hypothetical protein IJ759_05875 [Bacteroidales bacterium]|nr:hypothetical protein [Bacteroidales bacterium]